MTSDKDNYILPATTAVERSSEYKQLLTELKSSPTGSYEITRRLLEQGRRDGLDNDMIRKDIEFVLGDVMTSRHLRGILPLELKRKYTKANSDIMSELKHTGTVKQLASDSISKRITAESTPISDMISDLKQQPPAQIWDQRVAEAEARINKDIDPLFSYGTVEEFNIDLLDQYDIEYLRKVVIYLYKQVTQLSKDNKRLLDMDKHAAELIQEQSKQLMKQNTQLPGNKEETATTA